MVYSQVLCNGVYVRFSFGDLAGFFFNFKVILKWFIVKKAFCRKLDDLDLLYMPLSNQIELSKLGIFLTLVALFWWKLICVVLFIYNSLFKLVNFIIRVVLSLLDNTARGRERCFGLIPDVQWLNSQSADEVQSDWTKAPCKDFKHILCV